jgi:gas vesicle protein
MKKFIITEEEKNRILNMHVKKTKNQYLTENFEDSYTAEEAMNEIVSYVDSVGCSEGKNRLLQDVSRFVEEAQKELSEEEFEKFYSNIDKLMQEIDEYCSDDDEEDDDDFYHGGEGSGGRW